MLLRVAASLIREINFRILCAGKNNNKMVTKKDWTEFRNTGLLLFINQILHVFGWAIVFEIDDETNEVKTVYPARVKFRGFNHNDVGESYLKINSYLAENADQLLKEAREE